MVTMTPTGARVNIAGNFTSKDAMSVKSAAVNGGGLTLLPDFTIQDEVSAGLLEVLLTDYLSMEVPLSMVVPQREQMTTKVRVLADFLKQVFAGDTLDSGHQVPAS